jgi:mono/diheme cytochrome c family protein
LGLALIAAAVFAAPPAVEQKKVDLPDGAGKATVERVCSQCHGLENVVKKHKTAKEWSAVIDDMATRGAQATDQEFDQIQAYLATNFGPASK